MNTATIQPWLLSDFYFYLWGNSFCYRQWAGNQSEHLDRIFTHEFTTKANGHGFGLHSSGNYMTEMGGEIKVSSAGKGKGATFTLIFPNTSQQIKINKQAKQWVQ